MLMHTQMNLTLLVNHMVCGTKCYTRNKNTVYCDSCAMNETITWAVFDDPKKPRSFKCCCCGSTFLMQHVLPTETVSVADAMHNPCAFLAG